MARLFSRQLLDTWFLVAVTLALVLAFRLIEPDWLNGNTLQSVVAQNAPLAVVAMAMTFSIISRHIDLSPGSLIALSGTVIGLTYAGTNSIVLAVMAGVLTALLASLVNGVLVAWVGLSSIMVTLAAYIWARGLSLALSDAHPIPVGGGLPELMNTTVFGFSPTAPIVLIVFALGGYLLARTRLGRYTYAMGGDLTGARRAGINVVAYTLLIFGLMGVMVGLGAIIVVGQLGATQPYAATGLELDAIIAVIIGGTRLNGGDGNVGRTALGVAFVGLLNSGLLNLGLTDAYYQLYRGVALLAVLAVQITLRRWLAEESRRRQEQEQVALAAARFD
ncbi:MAG: ABC transporter permease [Chloroflexi bacterium]|nr:ABC transporter permease [Chloroflexota bacterium]